MSGSGGAEGPRSVLERCLGEPGYTPPARALPGLLDGLLSVEEPQRGVLERALLRAGAPAVRAALAALAGSSPEQRPELLGVLARMASRVRDEELREALLGALTAALGESAPRNRKLAARALGKLGDARAEEPLLAALRSAPGPERASIVDALSVVGGAGSLAALCELPRGDGVLLRRCERARLLIERRQTRGGSTAIVFDRPLGPSRRVRLSCRAGLSEVLASELAPLGRRLSVMPAAVELDYAGTLAELLVARTALHVALPVPLNAAVPDPVERIAEALASPDALEPIRRWSRGLPRFRVAWSDGGHHRAQAWALARAVQRRTGELVNDSQEALWSVQVRSDAAGELLLLPRLDPDPRFLYRVGQVPAASHPTIAAALARLAGVREAEVVWDPFVGSGLELVERARLGPLRELWGSDLDPRALEAARANLAAAGLSSAHLVQGSALDLAPRGVTLILTNPPMGRRVARDGSLGALLDLFVAHAAEVLVPGGRLVWLSPLGERTAARARAAGFAVSEGARVDMGGFWARVQTFQRPA